jgi:hypothetical protein
MLEQTDVSLCGAADSAVAWEQRLLDVAGRLLLQLLLLVFEVEVEFELVFVLLLLLLLHWRLLMRMRSLT